MGSHTRCGDHTRLFPCHHYSDRRVDCRDDCVGYCGNHTATPLLQEKIICFITEVSFRRVYSAEDQPQSLFSKSAEKIPITTFEIGRAVTGYGARIKCFYISSLPTIHQHYEQKGIIFLIAQLPLTYVLFTLLGWISYFLCGGNDPTYLIPFPLLFTIFLIATIWFSRLILKYMNILNPMTFLISILEIVAVYIFIWIKMH
jgi:hypothetical protein